MYTLLEGKAKEEFDNWYEPQLTEEESKNPWIMASYGSELLFFKRLNPSMQWGVLVDFFDSVNIRADVVSDWVENKNGEPILIYHVILLGDIHGIWASRHEAREEAIKQEVKIFNEQTK